jgi:hypothetical protein
LALFLRPYSLSATTLALFLRPYSLYSLLSHSLLFSVPTALYSLLR